ncbi:type IV pilus assembly protein PilM [Desulforamulus aeronauticus]|uniref:Type IV pilus assembly protein PilM n=1 Tax=Desulforamulus aeronauticus DSM 10349 TaxID=1121421 RepID=A0A1M6PHP0_9FIRM|nr:type IV pilus assembly protein PilM [Desulforamulus aeronauticus]SHK07430.1 type IV pilus assembly protein PilM [Desulforamulus aeronauticus DSM 10349]
MKANVRSLSAHLNRGNNVGTGSKTGGLSSLISFLTKKNYALGIDIGSRFLKVVQISKSGKDVQIDYYGSIKTPQELGSNSFPEEMLAAELARLLDQLPVKRCPINVTIGAKIITRHIRMPEMPAKELVTAIKWEAEKYIPIPVDELVLDYVNLGSQNPEGHKQSHILLTAITRETVEFYHRAFSFANLQLAAVDLSAFAIWRVFVGMNRDFPKEVTALLDLGYSSSQMIVVKNRKIVFTRLLPVGARTIFDTLARNLQMDLRDIRQAFETDLERLTVGNDNTPGLQEFLGEGIGDFVREVRRSLEFFSNQEKDEVSRIVITGGTANFAGIDLLLAEELRLPIKIGSSMIPMKDRRNETLDPSYTVALGLALREVVRSVQS